MDSLTDGDKGKRKTALFKVQERELENAIRESSPALREIALERLENMHEDGSFQAYFSEIGAVRKFMEGCLDKLS